MKKFKVTDIMWDTDGEEVDGLPASAIVEAEDDDAVVDALSDEYGWLIKYCCVQEYFAKNERVQKFLEILADDANQHLLWSIPTLLEGSKQYAISMKKNYGAENTEGGYRAKFLVQNLSRQMRIPDYPCKREKDFKDYDEFLDAYYATEEQVCLAKYYKSEEGFLFNDVEFIALEEGLNKLHSSQK